MTRASPAKGQVVLVALVFFGIFVAVTAAFVSLLTLSSQGERIRLAEEQALRLAEGGIDKAAYELDQNGSYAGESGTALGAGTFSTTVTTMNGSTKEVSATGYVPNAANPAASKTVRATLSINTSVVSFRYGVQVGKGGVTMNNGSSIEGSLASDGSISGSGAITGDVIVASDTPPTSLSGIHVQGSVWAHALSNCTIDKDAYYQTISRCSVGGVSHPGSADQPSSPLPISDQQISDWENAATAGGVIAGSYVLNGSAALGPKEVDGDFSMGNGASLTLTGPLWIRGNVSLSNDVTIAVSSSLGANGAVIIADNPADQSSQGTISVSNGVTVSGNGQSGSSPMLLSTNSGSSAISIGNNAIGAIFYAGKGGISVSNNAHATQITAYALHLNNNAVVQYDAGLESQSFSNGPGGSWAFVPGTYGIKP